MEVVGVPGPVLHDLRGSEARIDEDALRTGADETVHGGIV
jgi:hypothetical protein